MPVKGRLRITNCVHLTILCILLCVPTILNCEKCYTGRSVRVLRVRIGEHRSAFYQVLGDKTVDPENDDFSLVYILKNIIVMISVT